MKLAALRLHNVRRFGGRGVAIENIGDGVNVLCEVNEFGKSTCFDALHALFFSPYSGTPGAVQALRPYSGGNPLVEADIVTDTGRYRLRKQFYGGRHAQVSDLSTGRLVAQADEAEAFIGSLVRGGTAGPAGLLWVRQGNTGLDRRAKSDEDNEKRARETVLSSVQGEVESITGGRRMRAIVEACELDKLVTTTGRPKAGGPYAAAIGERDDLLDSEQRLSVDVEALHEALERRRHVKARVTELADPEEHILRQANLVKAEQQVAEARLYSEKLKTVEAEARLRLSERDAARDAFESYSAALARHAELSDVLSVQGRLRDEARAHRTTMQSGYDAAVIVVDRAEKAEQEARALLDKVERAGRARAAAQQLAEVHEALRNAEALRQEIEGAEAAVRYLSLPSDIIQKLEALELEITQLRAAEAVRATTIHMDYSDDAGRIDFNGAPLPGQAELPLSGTARLILPNLGTLTIRPSSAGTDHANLAECETERRRLLDILGVDSVAAAHLKQEEARTRHRDAELAKQKLVIAAPKGFDALREHVARLEQESQGDEEGHDDPEQARHALESASQQVSSARYRLGELRPQHEQAVAALTDAETGLAGTAARLEALDGQLGDTASRSERKTRLADSAAAMEAASQAADAIVLTMRAEPLELETAEAALARARSVADSAGKEMAELDRVEAELNGRIRAQSDRAIEEELQEVSEKRRAADEAVGRYEREVRVLVKVRDALNAARADAREHYFAPVMAELRPLLNMLFDDATVIFDAETLLPSAIRRNGLEEQIPVLSGGMREQLAVLTRLAFARLLAREGRPAPVILDDALVYSDDDRIEKMFDALHRQARNQQIIIFSCRQRAFSKLGGNKLSLNTWEPLD